MRIYEKANLVTPKRTKQNTRLYSQADIEKLQRIIRLHQELGINLAGIEVIMHMRQKMMNMQFEFEKIIRLMKDTFGADLNVDLDENSTNLVPLSEQGAQIMRMIDILKSVDEKDN